MHNMIEPAFVHRALNYAAYNEYSEVMQSEFLWGLPSTTGVRVAVRFCMTGCHRVELS